MARLALLGAALLCALAVSTQGLKLLDDHTDLPSSKYNYYRHGIDWRENGEDSWSCAGNMQSPINIDMPTTTSGEDRSDVSGIYLNGLASPAYDLAASASVNAEQDMQITFADVNMMHMPAIKIGGKDVLFKPLQLHFHHFLSEHALNGAHFPLESHLVMQAQDGSGTLAVLGVMYEYGPEDPFLERLHRGLRERIASNGKSFGDDKVNITDFSVNVMKDVLPPTHHNYVGYDGSLTTPPCSEVVKWHVFTEPRTVSVEQLRKFLEVTKHGHTDAILANNRIVQPIGRPLYHYRPTPAAYNYARKGYDWREASLDKCAGNKQSPINIDENNLNPNGLDSVPGITMNGLESSSFRFTDSKVNLEQDMKISFTAPDDNLPTVNLGTETDPAIESFKPLQLHFHHFSSEHTVNGKIYPLEAHLVMASQSSNQLMVIGIFYEYGSEPDSFLDRLHGEAISAQQGSANWGDNKVPINLDFSFAEDLMPTVDGTPNKDHWAYDGSLTTPPCDERVRWIVMQTPRKTTAEQMETFKTATVMGHSRAEVVNNRVIQSRELPNGDMRPITSHTASA